MAVARSQKEIRQRAPWWLVGLLIFNLGIAAYDARDKVTKQRVIRVWAQSLLAPFQSAASGVGGAGSGFFQYIGNLRNAASENVQLKQRIEQMETEFYQLRSERN